MVGGGRRGATLLRQCVLACLCICVCVCTSSSSWHVRALAPDKEQRSGPGALPVWGGGGEGGGGGPPVSLCVLIEVFFFSSPPPRNPSCLVHPPTPTGPPQCWLQRTVEGGGGSRPGVHIQLCCRWHVSNVARGSVYTLFLMREGWGRGAERNRRANRLNELTCPSESHSDK